jgi:hypothetical protein
MNTIIFDVMLGLVFVYILFALLCTTINELISRMLGLRARNLREGIGELLSDPVLKGLAQEVYRHPLIQSLSHDRFSGMKRLRFDVGNFGEAGDQEYVPAPVSKRRLPSYISAKNFTTALLDVLGKDGSEEDERIDALGAIRKGVDNLETSSDVQKALIALIDEAEGDIDRLKLNVQNWFDDAMDRVTGWYTRRIQYISLLVALFVTLLFNVNTVQIATDLWNEPATRVMLTEQAAAACPDATKLEDCTEELATMRSSLPALPLGWRQEFGWESFYQEAVVKLGVVGWVVTALALSLGAPFWFGLLVKIRSIRTTGIRPEDKPPHNRTDNGT